MIRDQQEAAQAATTILTMKSRPGLTLVIDARRMVDTTWGWVFYPETKEFLETGDLVHAQCGLGPVFVDRFTGEIREHGSGRVLKNLIAAYEAERGYNSSAP